MFSLALALPWKRRADAAHADAQKARREYERLVAQRPRAEAVANDLRTHRETNGWTGTIIAIFGGRA